MSLQQMLSAQVLALHTAIMTTCRRAEQPEHSDAMALRMHGRAVAMGRLQLAMLAMAQAAPAEPEPHEPRLQEAARNEPEPPEPEPSWAEPESCEATLLQPEPPEAEPGWIGLAATSSVGRPPAEHRINTQPDRPLTGDALSRFVSRRIEPSDCAHAVWQQSLMEGEANAPQGNFRKGSLAPPSSGQPASPGAGFRSPPA